MLKSSAQLRLENLALRQQLTVLRRSAPRRLKLTRADRIFWVWLQHVWGDWKSALMIVKAESKRLSNPPVIPGDLMLKLAHERKAGGSSGTVAQPCGSGSIGRRVRSERAHATGVLYEARVVIGNAGSVSETTAAAG